MDNKTWEKELEEKVREAIRLKLIPGKGESITWEAYKDINKIEEFGYIGDAINGKTIHQNKYPEFFAKEMVFVIRQLLSSQRASLLEEIEKIIKEQGRFITELDTNDLIERDTLLSQLKDRLKI